jgi:subtilisin family serine protease
MTFMVRIRSLLLALVLIALLGPESAAAESATRIIVKRAPGLTAAERTDVRADAGVRLVETLSLPRTEVVTAPAGDAHDALRELNADADVVYAELDARRQAAEVDTWMGLLWGLRNTGQSILGDPGTDDADMDVTEAWGSSTGAEQTVAVVDTGVRASHPDLVGRVFGGYDWVQNDANPEDQNGHGTHVTGTIVAMRNNGKGIAGVAPDAIVVPLRVLDANGSGYASDSASAFDWAGDHGVRVVNASFTSTQPSFAEASAIAGHPETLYVVAAGNDGVNVNPNSSPTYPCAYNLDNVVCVGASDNNDDPASFSNYGATSVDVFAPGVLIVSAYLAGGDCPDYCVLDGTSMASPHIAAEAALLQARDPSQTAAEMKNAIIDSVDAPAQLSGLSVSGGRANANVALQSVVDNPGAQPIATSDIDADTIPDAHDICIGVFDPAQTDSDQDGIGNACDSTPTGVDADGDGVGVVADNCPNQYGTGPDGCPVATPTPTPNPPVAGDSDHDGVGDASDGCKFEFATTANGCPLPAVAMLSAKTKRCGSGRCVTVRVQTSRAATVRVTVERRKCGRGRCRWVRVTRKTTTTTGNVATVRSGRLARGSYRAVVVVSSSAGRAQPETDSFRVR